MKATTWKPSCVPVVRPDVRVTPAAPGVGFVHRRLPYADVYFVANTSNVPVHATAGFAVQGRHAEVWDPMSGAVFATERQADRTGPVQVPLGLEPYGSRVIVFTNRPRSGRVIPEGGSHQVPPPMAMSDGWHIRFPDDPEPRPVTPLRSWTEDPSRRFFSGVATYSREVRLDWALVAPGVGVRLDFGQTRPVQPHDLKNGMQAWLDAPVREAAVVWVNDRRVGSVWCPPYALDVTGALRAGVNHIRIDVANLAMNAMAGRPLPSYRLLNARYGTRFEPQDMDKVQAVPAGLLGEIRLVPFAR